MALRARRIEDMSIERAGVGALRSTAEILLADEPTGNLDSKTGKEILDLIGELNQDLKVTIIVVTHDPLVAKRTHHQIHIHDGKIKDGLKN